MAGLALVAQAAAAFYASTPPLAVAVAGLAALTCLLGFALHRRQLQAAVGEAGAEARRACEAAELNLRAVEALAQAIDAKDQTPQGHVRRTQTYAVGLGRLLGLSAGEIEALRAGALLHDVGKLAVPDFILNKPGSLTAAEFEKMKIHATVGADIIRRVGFPYPVEEVVRHHHERWDGAGYPEGLKGEEIPLVARIIGVVDFYDVTRCDRPYRAGMSREESLALLRGEAGKAFDPRVVELFTDGVADFDESLSPEDAAEQLWPGGAQAPGLTAAEAGTPPAAQPPGLRTIAEAQREVFALHEIARTVGASLSLRDTAALVADKLSQIVRFDACVVFVLDERTGRAEAVYAAGEHEEFFASRAVAVGEGLTGWVVANARSMREDDPALDLAGAPAEVVAGFRSVLSSPLVREDGAFGAITIFSKAGPYTPESVMLLETVCLHASSAVNNALVHERTKETALTDALTGLPNARALALALEQRLAECRRTGREPVAVLCLDLDGFRRVNEAHGYGVGDRLLSAFAALVRAQLRQMDSLARYSGDEFVAVMPTATSDVAAFVAERIRAAVESEHFAVRTGLTVRLCVSVGVGCYPADGETADELILAASRDMRRRKEAGRSAHVPAGANRLVGLDNFR
ncbi:MAG TPA: diguanylate cyclase [Pyrinomonadaceae bacterium]|nr:diguanylate cyclase [Pyrinomonadaceae bacterium]